MLSYSFERPALNALLRTSKCDLTHFSWTWNQKRDAPLRDLLEQDVLRAVPKHELPQCGKVLVPLDDRQEVAPSELSDLARKVHTAIREQELRLRRSSRAEQ
jgi:hypothetical protein